MEQILQNRPDLIVRLKEFETIQKVGLEKLALQEVTLQIEETRAYLSDKQNARNREEALTKATGHRDWLMMSLAIVIVLGFFGLIAVMIIGDNAIKTANNGPIN